MPATLHQPLAKKFRGGSSVQQLLAKVKCLKLEEMTEDRAARVALRNNAFAESHE
jgi:hypothetical protein